MVATGVTLAFSIDELSGLHVIRILLGAIAVAINLFCIVVAVAPGKKSRYTKLSDGADTVPTPPTEV